MNVDIQELFLRTVADLENRVQLRDPYEILRSSLLIRQLVLDGGKSLADQVNRRLRLPSLVFRIRPAELLPLPAEVLQTMTHLVPDGIDPEAAPGTRGVVDLARDQFLKASVGSVQGNTLTVQAVIDHAAHVLGGVHAEPPSSADKQTALAALSAGLRVGGIDPSLFILRPIGRIVVRAMAPLRAALSTP
jgi:hypothetical protein